MTSENYGDLSGILGLKNRVALINGGGQGIGRSSALLLATAGANVAIVDNVPKLGQKVVEEVKTVLRKQGRMFRQDQNVFDSFEAKHIRTLMKRANLVVRIGLR